MHTIYEKLWLISSELNHLTKVNKKSLYMAISVMFWILVATIVCVVLEIFCNIGCNYWLRSCYTGIFRSSHVHIQKYNT